MVTGRRGCKEEEILGSKPKRRSTREMGWRQRRRQRELDDGNCKEQSRKALKNWPAVKREWRREDARKRAQEKEKWWKLPVPGPPKKKAA